MCHPALLPPNVFVLFTWLQISWVNSLKGSCQASLPPGSNLPPPGGLAAPGRRRSARELMPAGGIPIQRPGLPGWPAPEVMCIG